MTLKEGVGYFAHILSDEVMTEYIEDPTEINHDKVFAANWFIGNDLVWQIWKNGCKIVRSSTNFASIFYTWTTYEKYDRENVYEIRIEGFDNMEEQDA